MALGVARVTLLSVTVLGTMCNNVVNVPLRSIAADLDASLSAAVLCVSAFVLALAIAMPVTGWLGDRFGQKRTLVLALVLMLVAQSLAALAPNLTVLVVLRGVQGLACSAIPPMVMGLLGAFHPDRRIEMMSAWAAANGVGQAVGPPTGGVISDAFGWRTIFVVLAVACLLVLVCTWLFVPAVPRRESPFDVRGAVLLTGGVGLVLVAATTLSQRTESAWVPALEAVAGLALGLGYVAVSRGRAQAMIPLWVLRESRFLRSTTAAFGQMFCLGTVLVALPLYFTGPLGLSRAAAGVLFFTLPAVMVLAAPVVSRLSRRHGPRLVLRSGLVILVAGTLATGLVASLGTGTTTAVLLTVMMLVLGIGMAAVQTPAAAGASSSPAGGYGAALGLFSMMRFSGSAIAAAWVALVYSADAMPVLFGGCAVLAGLGLAASYLGPDPPPMPGVLIRTPDPG
ncbi:MAG: MFS transporter [Nocardioidaceae bacterium]|nr:MFS transporter [Nocardioidaceae bacterium]